MKSTNFIVSIFLVLTATSAGASAHDYRSPSSGSPAFTFSAPDAWDGKFVWDVFHLSAPHSDFLFYILPADENLEDVAAATFRDSGHAPATIKKSANISGFQGFEYDLPAASDPGSDANLKLIVVRIDETRIAEIVLQEDLAESESDVALDGQVLQSLKIIR